MRLKPLIALVLLAGAAAPSWAADGPLTGQVTGPAQAAPKPDYHCPPAAYLNCMPPITEDRRQSCSKDYVAWVKANCPNTQVVY
jgi:hypothetical protein